MKEIIKNYLIPLVAAPVFQPFLRIVHRSSLAAMNIGIGSDVNSSGELHAQKYVSRLLQGKKAPVIFDVGANVGKWTLSAAKIFSADAQIHCFEPSVATCRILTANLAATKRRVEIHNVGVGATDGELTLYRPEQSSVASLYHRSEYASMGAASVASEKVIIKQLDKVCLESGVRYIDYLKLDIEGHELAALKGCKLLLDGRAIQAIQFEFGGCNIDSRTYFRDFWELLSPDYKLYRLLPRQLYEIKEYHEWMEQFTTTNFLAILKRESQEKRLA
jgi:FkbM family methyltransferase